MRCVDDGLRKRLENARLMGAERMSRNSKSLHEHAQSVFPGFRFAGGKMGGRFAQGRQQPALYAAAWSVEMVVKPFRHAISRALRSQHHHAKPEMIGC